MHYDPTMEPLEKDTRQEFLNAARRLYAERGFHGTSIAAIAEAVGLTKQALLHHFGSKEKLYDEVLAEIAQRFVKVMETSGEAAPGSEPLQHTLMEMFDYMTAKPEDARLILRELLDNPGGAGHSRKWYLRPLLDLLVARARQSESLGDLGDHELLAVVYQMIGGINYFAVSGPTLAGMYGAPNLEALSKAYPLVLEGMLGLATRR